MVNKNRWIVVDGKKIFDGQSVKGILYSKPYEGAISIERSEGENTNFYLCQNVENGSNCRNKHGFKYSYSISVGDLSGITIIPKKNSKPAKVNYVLAYIIDDVDPVEEFTDLKEVKERVKTLMDNRSVQQNSYKLYKVSQVLKVKPIKTVTIR